MNKNLFVKISTTAHRLTKLYVKKYGVSYSLQFGIFFKMLYSMHKKQEKTETLKTVKAGAIYKKSKQLYKMLVGALKVDKITFFIKGSGVDLKYFISTTTAETEKLNTDKVYNLWELLAFDLNVITLLY